MDSLALHGASAFDLFHLKNLLYLFSDLIRNYFYEACPLKPLYLLVNPAGGAAPLFERECLTSPLFPHRVANFMC